MTGHAYHARPGKLKRILERRLTTRLCVFPALQSTRVIVWIPTELRELLGNPVARNDNTQLRNRVLVEIFNHKLFRIRQCQFDSTWP